VLLSVSVSHGKGCSALEAEREEAHAKTCQWGRQFAQVWSKTSISRSFSKYVEHIAARSTVFDLL